MENKKVELTPEILEWHNKECDRWAKQYAREASWAFFISGLVVGALGMLLILGQIYGKP